MIVKSFISASLFEFVNLGIVVTDENKPLIFGIFFK